MSQTFDCAQVIMTSESNLIGLLREKEIYYANKYKYDFKNKLPGN